MMDEWIEQYSTPDDRARAPQAAKKSTQEEGSGTTRPPAKKKPAPRTPKRRGRGRS